MTDDSPDMSFPGDHAVEILTSADGEHVALHDLGGDGPNLLFGHGNGLNAGMWAAIVPLLADRFHCYGIDLRGHGRCRPVNADYSVERERFGQDVIACIEALGAEPTRICRPLPWRGLRPLRGYATAGAVSLDVAF